MPSLAQVGVFGDPGRDPRGWTVSIAHAAVVPSSDLGAKAADDAEDVRWFPINELPDMAFDHKVGGQTQGTSCRGSAIHYQSGP